MNSTLIVARREFRSNFDSPIGYVVIALSLVVVGVFFFRDYWTINRATLNPLFTWLPWAFLFVVPAITMRLFSEEKRTGTLELLITMPVRDREVVVGKFLATLGVVAVLLALTLTYPLLIKARIAPSLDWGPIFVGYLGLLLEAAAGIGIGLFFSSITENQIIAFMLTAVTLLGLFAVGYLGAAVGGVFGDIFAFIDFQRRLAPFGRGLLDLRNVVYFLSIAAFFLMLTTRQLESRKWK
jgi:ABC-2 type transport system permease protein